MMISPSDPSTLMVKVFGDTIRPLRDAGPIDRPATDAEIATFRIVVEEAAANGLAAFDALLRFDLNWRTSVFRGEIEHDEAIETLIRDNLREWADTGDEFLRAIDSLKVHGTEFPAVATIRAKLAEARGMLIPDDEFFEGEELDDMASRAIDEDKRGLTVEFEAMGK